MKIAFVAKAGAGKTTLARMLVEEYGFVRLSFAKQVKSFASSILSRPIDKKRDRRFLQMLGEGARASDSLIWIKWLSWSLAEADEEGQSVVVDDCRYLNEAQWLKSQGFVLIRVLGGGHEYNLPKNEANHESEVELEKIKVDYRLDATGKIEEAYKNLVQIISKIAESPKFDFYQLSRSKSMRA